MGIVAQLALAPLAFEFLCAAWAVSNEAVVNPDMLLSPDVDEAGDPGVPLAHGFFGAGRPPMPSLALWNECSDDDGLQDESEPPATPVLSGGSCQRDRSTSSLRPCAEATAV